MQNPAFLSMQETHLSDKDIYYLRVKVWRRSSKQMAPSNKLGFPSLCLIKKTFDQKLSNKKGKDIYKESLLNVKHTFKLTK